MSPVRVCVAGAGGWVGRPLAAAVIEADDLQLVGAVSRSQAGRDVGELVGATRTGVRVSATLAEALRAPADVMVDYTAVDAVGDHVGTALDAGVAVVVGTSGLTAQDYEAINARARQAGVGVVASGNFSPLAAALSFAAMTVGGVASHWEVLDYGSAGKPDAPSGTARELAERLEQAHGPPAVAPRRLQGPPESRGLVVAGTRVHSVRLPGFVVSTELVAGLGDQRVSLRHEAGSGPDPYVEGTLLAIRRVGAVTGLVRGLDRLLFA